MYLCIYKSTNNYDTPTELALYSQRSTQSGIIQKCCMKQGEERTVERTEIMDSGKGHREECRDSNCHGKVWKYYLFRMCIKSYYIET